MTLNQIFDELLIDLDHYALSIHPDYGLPLINSDDWVWQRDLLEQWLYRHAGSLKGMIARDDAVTIQRLTAENLALLAEHIALEDELAAALDQITDLKIALEEAT